MLIEIISAAAAGAAPAGAKGAEYGLLPMLHEAWETQNYLTIGTFILMVIMSVGVFFILFSKWWEQKKIFDQGQRVRGEFFKSATLADGMTKLEKDTPYRQIVEDGLRAEQQHTLLQDAQDQHDWTLTVMQRTRAAIDSKLKSGLSFLATVGSTAPFVGLFGTVMGILAALVKIGSTGQASIDTVAGPVGEALIMTAIGLAVAVPAVLAYNWLQGRNKALNEEISTFVNDVHGWMQSKGQVKPMRGGGSATAARPAAAPVKA
jgi:biopolymer transport protein ExbB